MDHLEPDLNVAAYLLTRDFRLVRLERMGRRFAFVFESSPEVLAAAQELRSGTSPEARLVRNYASALKNLKDQLFAAKFAENRLYSEKFQDGNEYEYPRR